MFVFLLLKEKQAPQKMMITGISGFVFCPKMAVSWRLSVFQELVCWNPLFSWVRAFWAIVKQGNFESHQKENFDW